MIGLSIGITALLGTVDGDFVVPPPPPPPDWIIVGTVIQAAPTIQPPTVNGTVVEEAA